jgi:hypothetical protein
MDVSAIISSLLDEPHFLALWSGMSEEQREDFTEILSGGVEDKIAAREREILVKLAESI